MRGLTAEVSKNVVLAGIKSLTVLDDRVLSDEDCATRFLCPTVGENVGGRGFELRALRITSCSPVYCLSSTES